MRSDKMILIKGIPKTNDVVLCKYDKFSKKYHVKYDNGYKTYEYSYNSVKWLDVSRRLDAENYQVVHKGIVQYNITSIIEYYSDFCRYYRICFSDGAFFECSENELELRQNVFADSKSRSVINYFKEVSRLNGLKNDKGESLLLAQYNKIFFVANDLAVAPYFSPDTRKPGKLRHGNLIFPFGCNNSQLKAVNAAFENQISVVQGPPGTGKTQTILTIIANILMEGKTVLVVSNNNSAIENVKEKLAKHDLDFLVATLGKAENKQLFIQEQRNGRDYPSQMSQWTDAAVCAKDFVEALSKDVEKVQSFFVKQERLAEAIKERDAVGLEYNHFKKETGVVFSGKSKASSEAVMKLLVEYRNDTFNRGKGKITLFLKKLKYRFLHKIGKEYIQFPPDNHTIDMTYALYYCSKETELRDEIKDLEAFLAKVDAADSIKQLSLNSMRVLKNRLAEKYNGRNSRVVITDGLLYSNPKKVLDEFPVVLSTTFSARTSLPQAEFDYVIMDEASQVSPETGVLSLMCAKNAVIVGDVKQLPNVVTDDDRQKLEAVFSRFNINKGYDCSNKSFLQSIIDVIPSVPQTLLREHYRCAPAIINFCNQKFYNDNLIVMTKTDGVEMPVTAVKTVVGNHARDRVNQREIDVICNEIIPRLNCPKEEIGIIAPYNMQVDALKHSLANEIEVATVHKFQGREKDVIIMSVVDDQITEFADDPNLLNVAVSRAKKKFVLVVSGNEQTLKGNIADLLGYIDYNRNSLTTSKLNSIFDLLYKQYAKERTAFLKKRRRVSEFDSENLADAIIEEVLKSREQFSSLEVLCHYPVNLLVNKNAPLNSEERQYATNPLTHVDFLICSRVDKKPVLAIEVDGWNFHKKGTRQALRDELKNSVLPKCGLQLLRLSTTGSSEKEKIENYLDEIMGRNDKNDVNDV